MNGNGSPPVNDAAAAEFDVIVLGAGISGLVSASVLVDQGNERVLVIDEYDHVGGNHIDCRHEGYTFDIGSLVFQDDSPLLQHFPELLPRYVPIDPSWGKLNPQGTVAQYPFSIHDDFFAAGFIECVRILVSAGASRLRRRPLKTAGDFARFWIGARLLHRSGLENYMERFCGLPAEQIDLKFAEKRMLWIAENASLKNLFGRLLKAPAGRSAPGRLNQQLARSPEGFTHLYQPAVERLESSGVTFALGAKLRSLQKVGSVFQVAVGDQHVAANRIVSTIPIDRVRDLAGMPSDEKVLPTVTLISLFFSFDGERGFRESILYNFSHGGAWKRLTMYSDFYGRHAGREFFAVEVIAAQVGQSVERAVQDFRQHSGANGLFAGDLQLSGTHVLDHAYPIYTEGAGDRAEQAIAALRAFGIESFGRQGGFQYQPTARVSTLEAEAAIGSRSTG